MNFRTILVTGGAGCIGREVSRELTDRGFAVRLFDLPEQLERAAIPSGAGLSMHSGSVLDRESLRDAIRTCDAVIHLAAYLGVRRTETNRFSCLEINIQGTRNVLDAAVEHRVRKIVFASSSEVYGEPLSNPVSETAITQGKSVYAVSKLAGEELCRAYSERHRGLAHTILRYFNTYSPHQIAQFVIPRFVREVIEGRPPVIYGDGHQTRSYCYATDTARATVDALLCDAADDQIFNIGNADEPLSLRALASRIIDLGGRSGSLVPRFEPSFANADRAPSREIVDRYCDTSKARQVLGFAPRVAIDDGIRRMIEHGVPHLHWPVRVA